MKEHNPYLQDTKQSWLDLISIQFSGWMGIPVLASSVLILQNNSFLGSVLTIIVGNAIMWFIRLGIISMSYYNRQSTLDLARTYLGLYGGYFISVILLISTFAWYVAQTTIGGDNLTHLISIHENPQVNQFAQISVLLGIVSTLLCLEGMSLLRKLSLFCFPVLIISFFLILFYLPKQTSSLTDISSLSLSGLSLFLATNLGISSDLPTFFRHGRTWETALKALTIIQVLNVFFGILSLYLGTLLINNFEINQEILNQSKNPYLIYSVITFLFLSVICSNVASVYSASVGWELIAPSALLGRKEYLILGLGLTILFILTSNLFDVDFLLTISDCSLVNLCITLTLGYIISTKLKFSPNFYLQCTYFIAWFLSSIFNVFQYFYETPLSPLEISVFTIFSVVLLSLLAKKTLKISSD